MEIENHLSGGWCHMQRQEWGRDISTQMVPCFAVMWWTVPTIWHSWFVYQLHGHRCHLLPTPPFPFSRNSSISNRWAAPTRIYHQWLLYCNQTFLYAAHLRYKFPIKSCFCRLTELSRPSFCRAIKTFMLERGNPWMGETNVRLFLQIFWSQRKNCSAIIEKI